MCKYIVKYEWDIWNAFQYFCTHQIQHCDNGFFVKRLCSFYTDMQYFHGFVSLTAIFYNMIIFSFHTEVLTCKCNSETSYFCCFFLSTDELHFIYLHCPNPSTEDKLSRYRTEWVPSIFVRQTSSHVWQMKICVLCLNELLGFLKITVTLKSMCNRIPEFLSGKISKAISCEI